MRTSWNLCNDLHWSQTDQSLWQTLQKVQTFYSHLSPVQVVFDTQSCCPGCLHILLMWSAIMLVDIHPSTSRSQNGRRSSIAAFHMSGSRSPGFFLRSRVSGCGGRCIRSLLANSSSSAGWMKLELFKTAQGNHDMMLNRETLLCTVYQQWSLK